MLKFFDFCSGIGGGRIGLENNGLECVGHCEIDEKTAETYNIFFDDNRNFADGKVEVSPRGSIKLGRVTLQRKGGDNGRPTANMLQFKIDPAELFDI